MAVPMFSQLVDLFYSEQFCFYRNIAAVLGSLYILRLLWCQLWQLLGGFCAFFLAPWGISQINLKKYGSWAVVTGASEGIGRGYALELARRGLNVVIMSRSQDKLQKVADEINLLPPTSLLFSHSPPLPSLLHTLLTPPTPPSLTLSLPPPPPYSSPSFLHSFFSPEEKYGCEVRIIPVDFSKGHELYPRIAEELQDLDIGVLVNNVGLSVEYPDYFTETPKERHYKIVQINCHPVVQMTHMLLPKMVKMGHGVVVNISSAAADDPYMLLSSYSPTKRFNSHFSDILRKEYSSKGIIVQDVKPWFVATVMSGIQRASRFAPDPITYTRAAVATIGIQHTTYGYFYHALQAYVLCLVPGRLLDLLVTVVAAKQVFLKKKAKQS